MGNLSDYQNPVLIQWNDTLVQITDTFTAINTQIILDQIPDSYKKITVTDSNGNPYSEVQEGQTINDKQFYCDYDMGLVRFNSNVTDGSTFTVNFWGRGILKFPAQRVYSQNANTDVVQNLQDIIDNGQDGITAVTNMANFDNLGGYVSTNTYYKYNIVIFQGSSFMCEDDNSGVGITNIDPSDTAHWRRLSSFAWKGVYSTSTTYNSGDFVSDPTKDEIYMALKDNLTNVPLSNSSSWDIMITAKDVIANAQIATDNATTQANYARTQGDYAKSEGDYAKTQGDNAKSLVDTSISKGTYNASTAYVVNNTAFYNGSTYRCIQDSTGNPPTNTTYWELVASAGSVASVTSSNSDITVTNSTTTPQLTLNSGTGANQIVKRDANGDIPDIGGLNTQSATLQHGLQVITTDQDTSMEVSFSGNTLINYMGRQGNFEDQGQWGSNVTIDTSISYFGSSSGKIDNSAGSTYKGQINAQKMYLNGKYILIAIRAKSANGTPHISAKVTERDSSDIDIGDFGIINTQISNKWDFYFNVIDFSTANADHYTTYLSVDTYGTTSDVVNFDGMVVYELTQQQYNDINSGTLTKQDVINQFPYVDSVQHTMNPWVKQVGKNLIPPFSKWNLDSHTKIIDGYELELDATSSAQTSDIYLNIIPNETYTFSYQTNDVSVGYINAQWVDENGNGISYTPSNQTQQTITAPSNAVKIRILATSTDIGTFTFSNPQLELGSTATEFETYTESHLYPIQDSDKNPILLASNLDGSVKDELYKRDGEWYRLKKWENNVVLDGSLSWTFYSDFTGYKEVTLSNFVLDRDASIDPILAKYDGKIMRVATDSVGEDVITSGGWFSGTIAITISDLDTGWGETYTPTSAEVQAYFFGWKMNNGTYGTNYDGTGTKTWIPWGDTDNTNAVTATPTSDSSAIVNKIYDHYKLSYQLSTPYEEQVEVDDSLMLIDGDNQVELGEGIIVREIANPYDDGVSANIARNQGVYVSSGLAFANEDILGVYKNGLDDTGNWVKHSDLAQGNYRINIVENLYDPTAQYTVTYLTLPYLSSSPMLSIPSIYNTTLKSVVDNNTKNISNLQDKSNILSERIENEKANKKQMDWISPTLLNTWSNFGSGYSTLGYLKDEFGFVHFKGLLKPGTALSNIFILPEGFRTTEIMNFPILSDNLGVLLLRIHPDGTLVFQSSSIPNNWISLDGISFYVGM